MHVPDHFLTPEASLVTGLVAASAVAATITVGRPRFNTQRIALTGATAAVIFGAQMVNYPILSGTSGHFMGGALAVALVGPRLALMAMTGVLALQSLLFGDGGITALGTNILVMGIVPIAVVVGMRRLAQIWHLDRYARTTAALTALVSVPAGALGLVGVYAVGGAGSVNLGAMAASMTGVHLLVGTGEMLITVAVLSLVMHVAPGTAQWDPRPAPRSAARRAGLALGASAVVSSTALAAIAASTPDGLESIVLAYRLPVGDAVITGLPQLSDYGAVAGTNLALVGLIGILGAGLATTALSASMRARAATT